MVITHHGAEFFKVVFGDTTLAFNPIGKQSKLKGPKFGADIALISLNHPDMNGAQQVSHGERQPFVIDSPGEYEIGGVFVRGYSSRSNYGGKGKINTVYFVTLEGMKLCFLGALGSKELSDEIRGRFDEIDLLFVPIGGEGVLEPAEAHELSVSVEPHVVIPMHYDQIGIKNALKLFLKEEGRERAQPEEKLTVKRRDLEMWQGEVVVLKS